MMLKHLLAKCLSIALLGGFLTSSLAIAGQNNPALPGLLAALKSAPDPAAAEKIANDIWQVWTRHDTDPVINRQMQRGLLLMRNGKLQQAAGLFTRIIEADPQFAEAWNKRATVYFQLGMMAESKADIARTLALEDSHFGALSGLGMVEIHLGRPEAALAAFRAAAEIHPQMLHNQPIIESLETLLRGRPL
jgi:tetratricopeptide (TPR) repeat protein